MYLFELLFSLDIAQEWGCWIITATQSLDFFLIIKKSFIWMHWVLVEPRGTLIALCRIFDCGAQSLLLWAEGSIVAASGFQAARASEVAAHVLRVVECRLSSCGMWTQ